MAIWPMRIASWITKATNTHSEYVILIAFPVARCGVVVKALRYKPVGCGFDSRVVIGIFQ